MLDTSKWKNFKFDEIFIVRNGFYNKKPEHTEDGNIPFLGATDNNNGVTEYYSLKDIEEASKTGDTNNSPITEKLFKGKALCVTNNGSVGFAYYQEEEFTYSHDVTPLYIKGRDFNRKIALFVATVIGADRYRWDYGRKWRPIRMKKSNIKLPADENGNPDWVFMDKFMENIENLERESNGSIGDCLTTNTGKVEGELNISSERWEIFYLHKLFKVGMGNGIDAVATTDYEPKYNYVSRNSNGNGVVGFVDEIDGEEPFPAGAMTLALGGSFLGSCFIQKKPFYTAQNVGILEEKEQLSIFSKLFIATLIRNECKVKYQAFGRELNSHFRKDFTIKLPVKMNGKEAYYDDSKKYSDNGFVPDWEWIDNYMISLPYSDRL